jgi:hypothetical protein
MGATGARWIVGGVPDANEVLSKIVPLDLGRNRSIATLKSAMSADADIRENIARLKQTINPLTPPSFVRPGSCWL